MANEVNTENDTTGRRKKKDMNIIDRIFIQMLTSVVYVDVKVRLIDHFSIHVYVMEVFDLFMMIGKISMICVENK